MSVWFEGKKGYVLVADVLESIVGFFLVALGFDSEVVLAWLEFYGIGIAFVVASAIVVVLELVL